MTNRFRLLAPAALAVLASLPASAQTRDVPGRYTMQPIEGGFLRLDTQTGAVSIKGFEIEITGQVTENLKVAGGYSYTDAKYSAGTYVWDPRFLDYIAVGGNQIESVPEHLASLWGVSDVSTSRLMKRFYGYLRGGKPKDEALQAVQIEQIREKSESAHPFHWAAFELFGDWR